jgi:TolB-like protein
MLITDLSAVPGIQIVEREKLNQALAELQLSRSRFIDPSTAQKLGRGLAARYLLTGGYTMAGSTLRIDARVFNVETGAVLASERVEGRKDEFFTLEARLVSFLATAIQVKIGAAGAARPAAGGTRSFDAWSQYSAGLDAQDRGDAARAREMFEKALRTDPAYQAARSARERLAAIFARQARETAAASDRTFEGLDPGAPDLAAKVDALLAGLDDTRGDQLSRKIKVLTWLGERGLVACARRQGPAQGNSTVVIGGVPMGGGGASYCRQAGDVLALAYRQAPDPSQWDVIPKVCEYFIHQLPGDHAVLQYCESPLLRMIDHGRRKGEKAARKDWAEDRKFNAKLSPDDWRRALLDNDEAMKAMLAIYARAAEGGTGTAPPR